jgi:predicted ATPase
MSSLRYISRRTRRYLVGLPSVPSQGTTRLTTLNFRDRFVKTKDNGENDLSVYCQREGIKHILINDFSEAIPVLEAVVSGRRSVDEVLAKGLP